MRLQKALTQTEEGYGVNDGVMPRPDDGSVPVAHHDIVAILEVTVGAGPIADAFLALLELFEKTEISRNYTTSDCCQTGYEELYLWP